MKVFTVWWYRLMLVFFFAFAASTFGYSVAQDSLPLALVLTAPMVFLLVRSARCATVRLDDDGVEIRGLFRTRRAKWEDVQEVDVVDGSSTGLPWRVPAFVLRTHVIRAEEVRSLRDRSVVDEVVAEADRRRAMPWTGRRPQ